MSMMMSEDSPRTTDPRIVYRAGRVAFALACLWLALSSASYVCYILTIHPQTGPLRELLSSPAWDWMVTTPATFSGFFAAFLLLGRWRDSAWLTRSTLFVLIQTYLIVYWCMDHRTLFGQPAVPPNLRADMTRMIMVRTLGFVALFNLATMAFEVLKRHGRVEEEGLYRSARVTCTIGLGFLALLAMRLYDHRRPWPPRFHFIRDLETFNISVAALIARPIAGALVLLLCAGPVPFARGSWTISRRDDRGRPVPISLGAAVGDHNTGRSSRSVLGSGKWTFSSRTVSSSKVAPNCALEVLDALLDHVLRGAGAGRDQDGLGPVEPLAADLLHAVDQVGVRPERAGDLGQPACCWSCSGCPGRAPGRPRPPARGRPPGGSAWRSRCRPWAGWRSAGTSAGGRRSRRWRRRRSGSSGSGRRSSRG